MNFVYIIALIGICSFVSCFLLHRIIALENVSQHILCVCVIYSASLQTPTSCPCHVTPLHPGCLRDVSTVGSLRPICEWDPCVLDEELKTGEVACVTPSILTFVDT